MSATPFSFMELQAADPVELPAVETVTASDGVKLAYRRYAPAVPRAVVLFYHGGGAHSGAGYQHFGRGLQDHFDTLVITPDIRGHGSSGGPKSDASAPKQVWADVTTFIKHIRTEFPQLPIFLGGHSSGAGLTLNYVSQPNHESLDGYIFVAPEFGFRSMTARPVLETPFAKVNTLPFIINAMSGGFLAGHAQAVWFHYPAELLASDPGMAACYTVNMANAVTPSSPHKQFTNLDRGFGLWIGANDELIMPSMVLAFADLAVSVRAVSEAASIPAAKHLSILLNGHESVGPWILRFLQTKKS